MANTLTLTLRSCKKKKEEEEKKRIKNIQSDFVINGSKQVIVLTFHGRQNCYMQKFNKIRNKPILNGNYCFLLLSLFTVFFVV